MTLRDLLRLASQSLVRARMRSVMMLIATAIGVAAVVLLTGLGEGARRYVTGEFRSLGTHLLIVLPGRSETTGVQPGLFAGETPRDLTIADAESLTRLPQVERIAPLVVGSAPVSAGELSREAPILGSTADLLVVRNWQIAQGRFLPQGEIDRDLAVAVIGANVKRELFPRSQGLGETLRIGDRRFRVIGILGNEGRAIGLDVQELVVIPVSSALSLFNSSSLFRIMVQARSRESMPAAVEAIRKLLTDRHQGEEDITVVTQDAVLATFDRIFTALTLTLAGIASVSLIVAGVLIMNVMLVAVSQRTSEIGLLKAIGARRSQVTALFLAEAVLLSLAGALIGLALGAVASRVLGRIYPAISFSAPLWAVLAALVIAVASGILFGLLPARRAAKLDPVLALAGRK
jgi:putative ABC transport system permease protein